MNISDVNIESRIQQLLASKQVARGAFVLIGLLIAWSLAGETWRLLGEDDAGQAMLEAAPAQTHARGIKAPSTAQLASSVARVNLFGRLNIASKQQATPTKAPDTRLNLTLNGTIASGDKQSNYAIIRNGSSKQTRAFAIGDKIFGLATLEEVYADRVILSRGGRYETLRLPEKRTDLKRTRNRVSTSWSVPTGAAQALLAQHREAIFTADFSSFKDDIGYKMKYNNKRLQGILLESKSDVGASMLSDLGLQSGDVIRGIGGVLLDSGDQNVMQAINRLRNAELIPITVIRDQQSLDLSLVIPR